jgi:hypothetical protein
MNRPVSEGPASVSVEASDYSYRGWTGGNRAAAVREFTFDLYPPRLEVFSGQHYINQGGSEMVVYRAGEDAVTSGVRVGPHFFRGYPAGLTDPTVHFALFAFAYDQPLDTAVQVVAQDAAGNESVATPFYRVTARAFRNREITIDDAFMNKVVPEILQNTPDGVDVLVVGFAIFIKRIASVADEVVVGGEHHRSEAVDAQVYSQALRRGRLTGRRRSGDEDELRHGVLGGDPVGDLREVPVVKGFRHLDDVADAQPVDGFVEFADAGHTHGFSPSDVFAVDAHEFGVRFERCDGKGGFLRGDLQNATVLVGDEGEGAEYRRVVDDGILIQFREAVAAQEVHGGGVDVAKEPHFVVLPCV